MVIDIFSLIRYEISLRQEKNACIKLKYNISNIGMSNNGIKDMLSHLEVPVTYKLMCTLSTIFRILRCLKDFKIMRIDCIFISLRQEKNAYIQLKYNISNIDMSNNVIKDMLSHLEVPVTY